MIFSFGALWKSIISSKRSETRNFIDFRTIFGPKIDPKSDAEQSLFCDAMEPARKSAKLNGAHDFWTTNLATQMIRSSWSASRRPNHQRQFLRRSCHLTFAKGTASSFATKFCSKSPDFERSWAENPSKLVPGRLKIAPKSKLKGMQSRSPSNALINYRFFQNFIDFRAPNWTTKSLKFASKTKSKKQ